MPRWWAKSWTYRTALRQAAASELGGDAQVDELQLVRLVVLGQQQHPGVGVLVAENRPQLGARVTHFAVAGQNFTDAPQPIHGGAILRTFVRGEHEPFEPLWSRGSNGVSSISGKSAAEVSSTTRHR